MKISRAQLKKIIAEEVKRARLVEGVGMSMDMGMMVSAELQTMIDAVCDGFKSQFDPMDPSMVADGGKEVWDSQCDAACDHLAKEAQRLLTELIIQVEEDLHSGQFYSGTGMQAPSGGKYRE